MIAYDVLKKAQKFHGHDVDLLEALSRAGTGQPQAVISSFHFLREVLDLDNLLEWHAGANVVEQRQALIAATELAKLMECGKEAAE